MWVITERKDYIMVNLDQAQSIRVEEKGKRKGNPVHRVIALMPGPKGSTKGYTLKVLGSYAEWEDRFRKSLLHRLGKHPQEVWDLTNARYWDCGCRDMRA